LDFGLAGFLSYALYDSVRPDVSGDVAALAWITPAVWVLFLHGCMAVVWAFSKWRGDYRLRLLLRLISEHQNKDI